MGFDAIHCHSPFAEKDTSIVDQDVQLLIPAPEIVHQLAYDCLRGKVGQHQVNGLIAAVCFDFSHCRFPPALIAADHHHGRAHLGQAQGGGLADA